MVSGNHHTDKLSGQEVQKEVQIHPGETNLNLYIMQQLKSGNWPAKIARQLSISKTALQYHLTKLKQAGAITKIGYGVWEVSDTAFSDIKRSTNSPRVGRATPPTCIQTNLNLFEVRGHAFVFTLRPQSDLRNWTNENRELYLSKNNIPYKALNLYGGGQAIVYKGHKVWLTNKSVILYDTGSYFAQEAAKAKSHAIHHYTTLIKGLERLLNADFTQNAGRTYKFKVSRQHYALINNALARQYNEANEKLEVYTDKGLWFLIDNSFNMNEAEMVHPETAEPDTVKVVNFFNSIKAQEDGITIDQLLQLSSSIQQNQLLFSENALAHVDVIKQLGIGVQELNKRLKDLEEVINK